jgi:hypothetical protein
MIDGVVDIKLIEESPPYIYIDNIGFVNVWRMCEC